MNRLALSIVVPCYNEEACLPELHRRLSAAGHAGLLTSRVAGGHVCMALLNAEERWAAAQAAVC